MTIQEKRRIWLFIASVWATALVVYATGVYGKQPLSDRVVVPFWLLGIAAGATQLEVLTFRLSRRNRATVYTFTEVTVIIGVLFCHPSLAVPGIAAGSLVAHAFIRQDMRFTKAAFNIGTMTLRHSLVFVVVSQFDLDPLSPIGWVVIGSVVMCTSVVEGLLVGVITAIAQGHRLIDATRGVYDFNHFVGFAITIQGLSLAIMLTENLMSVGLFGASVIVFTIASRTYLDETAQRATAEQQAKTDPLTGIGNRAAFDQAIDTVVSSRDHGSGVVFIDMDNFKTVNDDFGHHTGDLLLIEVAARLTRSVRSADLVARLGGDEFAVLLQPSVDMSSVLERITAELNADYHDADGDRLPTTASLGFVHHIEGESATAFIARADRAMYDEKAQRRRTQAATADVRRAPNRIES